MSTQDQLEFELEVDENGFYKARSETKKKSFGHKFKSEWQKYGDKLILAVGIVLIAAISFEAGYLKGEEVKDSNIVINKTAQSANPTAPAEDAAKTEKQVSTVLNSAPTTGQSSKMKAGSEVNEAPLVDTKNCPYVASKNSNKYHLASCQWAARIKSENKICFSSEEEAKNRGYQGAKCCIK
ncbi:MAG: hypothetical protein WC858_00330 [Parcubacteria group bacterium]|jgi:hypothetical protein